MDVKKHKVSVYHTADEFRIMKGLSCSTGLTTSSYLRQSALKKCRPLLNQTGIMAKIYSLTEVANNCAAKGCPYHRCPILHDALNMVKVDLCPSENNYITTGTTRRTHVFLNDKQYAIIKKLAKEKGVSVSKYISNCGLEECKSVLEPLEKDTTLYNLNNLAKKCSNNCCCHACCPLLTEIMSIIKSKFYYAGEG